MTIIDEFSNIPNKRTRYVLRHKKEIRERQRISVKSTQFINVDRTRPHAKSNQFDYVGKLENLVKENS